MRNYLKAEIEEEVNKRMNFNDAIYRYLPANLKVLIEAPPTRHEIYPKFIEVDEREDTNKQDIGLVDPNKLAELFEDWNDKKLSSFSKDIEVENNDSFVRGSIVKDDYFDEQQQPSFPLENYDDLDYDLIQKSDQLSSVK